MRFRCKCASANMGCACLQGCMSRWRGFQRGIPRRSARRWRVFGHPCTRAEPSSAAAQQVPPSFLRSTSCELLCLRSSCSSLYDRCIVYGQWSYLQVGCFGESTLLHACLLWPSTVVNALQVSVILKGAMSADLCQILFFFQLRDLLVGGGECMTR